jgi:hypothetical protein
MKKNKRIIGLFIAVLSFSSCNTNQEMEPAVEVAQETTDTAEVAEIEVVDTEKIIEEINQKRAEIEALVIEPVEILSADLREKTKQKWSKIHFYVQNDVIVKVKTYPYPEISKRTEEFYADENGLLLVTIEDNGDGPKGKSNDEIDKMYFFHENTLIQEINKEEKEEYSIRESDAEELMSEFNEYLSIYQTKGK